MTVAKSISGTLQNLLGYPVVQSILDRGANINAAIDEVQGYWGYDLFNRRPSAPYMEYGIFHATDLDLACFLYELAGRGSVINIPKYKALRQTKVREGEQLQSKYNRHGRLMGVQGNKDFFIFSIKVIDENVVTEDTVGEFRNFALTDFDGNFYPGWERIEFVPTLKENRFITENKLWTGNKIFFKHFIHPNRWTSYFGHHYVITKMLINRLSEEASHYYEQQKAILDAGIQFPGAEGPSSKKILSEGVKKSMKFTSFQTEVYIPEAEYKNNFPTLDHTQVNLVMAYRHRNNLLYNVIPKLRFMARATEYAHFKAPDRFPAWIKNVKWEDGFTIPGKRVKWERCKLFQTKPGEFSVSLLRRTYEKASQVDIDY